MRIQGIFTSVEVSVPAQVLSTLVVTKPAENPFKVLHAEMEAAIEKFEREYVLMNQPAAKAQEE